MASSQKCKKSSIKFRTKLWLTTCIPLKKRAGKVFNMTKYQQSQIIIKIKKPSQQGQEKN